LSEIARPASASTARSFERFADLAVASHRNAVAVLIVAALLAFLPGFFQLPPLDRDEPRYAQATSQMRETGNYLDIRFQDQPRHLQPAGTYWLQSLAVELSGYGAKAPIWVYRIPSLLGAITSVVLTYWVALAITSPAGAFIAALFMTASILLGFEARIAKTDAMLLACTLGAMGFLARAYLAKAVTTAGAMLFWTAMAAGVLIKGPLIVLVIGSTALALCAWDRSAAWLKALRPGTGIFLFLLLILPWFIAIGVMSEGKFFQTAVGKSFLGKVTTGEQGHGAPPGYYLLLFSVTFFPAAGVAALALPWTWRNRVARPVRFCLAWIVPTWVVFELVVTKLPHYVLPTYPAIAILTAMAVLAGKRPSRAYFAVILLAFTVYAALGHVLLYLSEASFSPAAAVVSAAGVAAAAWGFGFLHERPVSFAMAIALPAIVLHFAAYGLILPKLNNVWMAPRLADAIKRNAACAAPAVAAVGYHEPSLVFLVGTKTLLAGESQGADFLAAGGCRVVLVADRNEAEFRTALARHNRAPVLRERVDGINMGRVRRESIGIYTP